jgi:hypothetical protein
MAANASEFWYARKLVWLSARKSLEKRESATQPALGSYFDVPERQWTLTKLLAKGDTPDLIFYRRRTPESAAPQVLGPDAPAFAGLLPQLPFVWERTSGQTEQGLKWEVPQELRGKLARLEVVAASEQVEAFTLRLKFKHEGAEVAEYLLKPYLYKEGGKDFFVFAVPANGERCDITLKFSPKAKVVRFLEFRVVLEDGSGGG